VYKKERKRRDQKAYFKKINVNWRDKINKIKDFINKFPANLGLYSDNLLDIKKEN